MPIQVIGAGCGRTGTASLKKALEILGFDPCYHMFENVKHGHSLQWEAALNGNPSRAEWDAILGDFAATVDFPAAVAYKELMAAYPDAKVVLSVRDPQSWSRRCGGYGGEAKGGEEWIGGWSPATKPRHHSLACVCVMHSACLAWQREGDDLEPACQGALVAAVAGTQSRP